MGNDGEKLVFGSIGSFELPGLFFQFMALFYKLNIHISKLPLAAVNKNYGYKNYNYHNNQHQGNQLLGSYGFGFQLIFSHQFRVFFFNFPHFVAGFYFIKFFVSGYF